MTSADWIAIYAAIVATGALFLEVRRWFESGPKLYVKARPNMIMLDGLGEKTTGLLVVNVTNRGDAPTTITTFALLNYPNWWARWRNKETQSFIIPHPQPKGSAPILPHVLQPGQQWTGMAHNRSDVTGDIQTGTFWAAIYTTDRDRPYLAHIPKPKSVPALENATKV